MTRLVPVREIAALRLALPRDEQWIGDMTWVPVAATEIHLACRYFPLAVRFDGQTPRLGLIVGQRYLVHPLRDEAGAWRGAYRPIGLRCFPFSALHPGDDPLTDILIDAASPHLSATDGVPIVDGDGKPSRMLRELHRLFGLLKQAEDTLAGPLDQFMIGGLLAPLSSATDDEATDASQLYVLDPARFQHTKPAALGAMARHGLLSVDLAVACHFSLLTLRPEYRPKPTAEQRRQSGASAPVVTPMIAMDDLALALDDGELVSLWNIDALRIEARAEA